MMDLRLARLSLLISLSIFSACSIRGQETVPSAPKPLPDIPALMRDVEINQRKAEAVEKDYLYRSVVREEHLDGHGQLKKVDTHEFDVFWTNGVKVWRMVKKDGKELTPEEKKKESDRIDKTVEKARKRRDSADAKGKETDPQGRDEVTVSRLLELGSFTNPRRVVLHGRDTIAVDYTGDPKAKTHNRAEDVIRDMQGTAWIDEQDHVLSRVEGHFVNAFKIGGGLLVNIQKDTAFSTEQTKINGEVWLPAWVNAHGTARAVLFYSFNGRVQVTDSDYRKFKTTSRMLPDFIPVNPETPAPTTPKPEKP